MMFSIGRGDSFCQHVGDEALGRERLAAISETWESGVHWWWGVGAACLGGLDVAAGRIIQRC